MFDDIKEGHNPNKDSLPDQLVYALALSSVSYIQGLPDDGKKLGEFIKKGLINSIGELAEIVRSQGGLQYTDVFFEETDAPNQVRVLQAKPELILAIEGIGNDFAREQNKERVSQIEFLRTSQQMLGMSTLALEAPENATAAEPDKLEP